MNKKILIVLSALILIIYPMTAYAYDQSNPASITVNYVITTDTSFTVNIVDGRTAMNFTGKKDEQNVDPAGQNETTPWATITNGNLSQDFTVKLNSNNPSGIVLRVSNSSDMAGNISLTATAQSPSGWTNVSSNGTINLYAKASFLVATDGNHTRTLTLNSTDVRVLISVDVLPSSATIYAGETTKQLTATPRDQFGNPMTATMQWSSSNTSVATVGSTGLVERNTTGAGTVTITANATAGDITISDTATINVIASS